MMWTSTKEKKEEEILKEIETYASQKNCPKPDSNTYTPLPPPPTPPPALIHKNTGHNGE